MVARDEDELVAHNLAGAWNTVNHLHGHWTQEPLGGYLAHGYNELGLKFEDSGDKVGAGTGIDLFLMGISVSGGMALDNVIEVDTLSGDTIYGYVVSSLLAAGSYKWNTGIILVYARRFGNSHNFWG
jgi:hypothetical protein